ncbi:hypothetical protein [Gemmatimonas sp.]|uniref:hypothetical protein n=1 Tax=Gemmatimonas sp. TaxID=1962908 RepID=UPI0027BAC7C1|nr:hypothetical protein [Gemmatimonas sp.]
MRHFASAVIAAVTMVGGAVRAEAQQPTVQQVYDKFAEAVGGRAAWKSVVGRTDKGTANVTFAGISGSYERHTALPNKMRMIIDLGIVKIDQGFDGEKGWVDQGQGMQPMPAEQVKDLAEPSPDGAAFLDPSRYMKAAVVGKEPFEGADAWKVEATTKGGRTITEYFDVASGLRVGMVTNTPMGPQTAVYKDYKVFEGKKVATTLVQRNGQGDVILTSQIVTFGTPDAAYFKQP